MHTLHIIGYLTLACFMISYGIRAAFNPKEIIKNNIETFVNRTTELSRFDKIRVQWMQKKSNVAITRITGIFALIMALLVLYALISPQHLRLIDSTKLTKTINSR